MHSCRERSSGNTAGTQSHGQGTQARGNEGRYQVRALEASRTGERVDRIVHALQRVAVDSGRPTAQVALAWLRYRDIPVIPIIGARRVAQLEDNLASLSLELTRDQIDALDRSEERRVGKECRSRWSP